ncbi:E3 SUMO-protein ligase pli1 [Metarhizium brunneum]|uniref:E3 SUMO-protein ligase pli1 n=1 Tax=Metarhizium brunneum TaxID=500148 RepID=A0A7D5YZW7_9HYPO|nr:E3 SUMO-protein ligase pli1 [Metarhizium brunneum]
MATSFSPIQRQDVTTLVRLVQGNQLLNRQLSSICQVNGLKSTGVKAELQRRIVDLIQDTVNSNDASRFQQVRQSITNAASQRPSPSSKACTQRSTMTTAAGLPTTQFAPPMTSYNQAASPYQQRGLHGSTSAVNGRTSNNPFTSSTGNIIFHPSPFYSIETAVSNLRTCETMAQHRNSINIPIKASDHPALLQCLTDESYRVMIFCAGDIYGVQNVAFPHQSELKVNNQEIKANLRGLKNKPGSTRPVDITAALRLKLPLYINNVEFTYALTNKKFYLVANVCKITTVKELVSIISTRRRIPKESVVSELNKKAQDPDVVATSQVLSLKCPLSYMRLDVPCRSLSCTHIQCFDATSYLQLQEQGPQWLCPICNKSAPFEQLAVDEYVRDILANTPKDLEAVTIEPNGHWLTKASRDENPKSSNDPAFDDDDELEISEINIVGRRLETPKTITPITGTPASGGRDSSASAPRSVPPNSAKRPATAVIDLTLSSDDEEPLEKPRKRQNTAANGFQNSSSMGFLSESPGPSAPIQQHVYSSFCCRYTPDREIIALPASTTSIPSCHRFVQKQQEHLIAAIAMSLDPVMPPFNSSDPSANFLSSSCLDFLLIELVPLAYRVTNERDSTQDPSEPAGAQTAEAASTSHRGASLGSGGAHHASSSGTRKLDDEEELDAVHFRLESLGYRVGQGLVERFSRDRPRFNDTLDVIKFLCKDLWSLVFGKNIDNLKTNHRGVYVLTDNVFRPFSRMSTVAGGQAVVRAQPFLWFPCGIVRGALAALGLRATVQAEINELPGAVFQIKTLNSKP